MYVTYNMDESNKIYTEFYLPEIVKIFNLNKPSENFESIITFTMDWSIKNYLNSGCLATPLYNLN